MQCKLWLILSVPESPKGSAGCSHHTLPVTTTVECLPNAVRKLSMGNCPCVMMTKRRSVCWQNVEGTVMVSPPEENSPDGEMTPVTSSTIRCGH